jgi:hypothetical protein
MLETNNMYPIVALRVNELTDGCTIYINEMQILYDPQDQRTSLTIKCTLI